MSVSLWLDKNHVAHRSDRDDVELDVAVIGGGITGASIAYWLKDAGLRVGVIERGEIASGASGRNAGFITCGSVEHYSRQVSRHGPELAHTLWQHSQDNLALIRDLIVDQGGVDCDFKQIGTYSLAGTEHEHVELTRSAELMANRGIEVSARYFTTEPYHRRKCKTNR